MTAELTLFERDKLEIVSTVREHIPRLREAMRVTDKLIHVDGRFGYGRLRLQRF